MFLVHKMPSVNDYKILLCIKYLLKWLITLGMRQMTSTCGRSSRPVQKYRHLRQVYIPDLPQTNIFQFKKTPSSIHLRKYF